MTSNENSTEAAPLRLQGKYGAMVVCWILGLGSLVAWNSLLTIGDYYYNLFPPSYHPSRVLTLVYQPFALGTMAILAYYESKINKRKRNLAGFILFFLSTLAIVVLDLATSGKGGLGSYIGICVIVAIFGVADAHVEGGMVGELSFMCPEFMQSYLACLAASGALTSSLRLMTKAAFEKSDNGLCKGAMLFLSVSTFLEFLCILLFLYALLFSKLPVVKYYCSKAASEGSRAVSADLAAARIRNEQNQKVENDNDKQQERLSNKQLFFENVDYALDLFLIYVLSLSIIPGFLYENTKQHHLGSWYAIVLIAMYNVWDLIARYIPFIKCLKLKSRKGIMIATLARFLLIPAFYFTANYDDQGWMILLISFLGLTNGYLTVCVYTEAPKGYKGPEQYALGNLLVLCLLGGLLAGVSLDWLWLIGIWQQCEILNVVSTKEFERSTLIRHRVADSRMWNSTTFNALNKDLSGKRRDLLCQVLFVEFTIFDAVDELTSQGVNTILQQMFVSSLPKMELVQCFDSLSVDYMDYKRWLYLWFILHTVIGVQLGLLSFSFSVHGCIDS